ncbi:MAG: class I SAM-dependent methyltransferase [Clostridia bacterium]|nr:class I SAM-dependent methyltransferase [Clostridia bacterium]
MAREQYSGLSSVYDRLNFGCDYGLLAKYLSKQIKENESTETSLVLDLACGTGKLTLLLHKLGYDMTGVDLSENMLAQAKDACYQRGINDVLWLCQDMTELELYGTVDACVCTLDSINYLTSIKDVKKCFSLVHNYLIPEGVFVFDINTPYRFENVYGQNDYVLEDEQALLAWQNDYNKKTKICNFYLSIFEENKDGTYTRLDEVQREKCYSRRQIENALSECGFEIISVHGDLDGKTAEDTDEKWYFTVKCKK